MYKTINLLTNYAQHVAQSLLSAMNPEYLSWPIFMVVSKMLEDFEVELVAMFSCLC